MSVVPSSIKLLKIGTSNSHIKSSRLSTVVNLTASKLNSRESKTANNQTVNSAESTVNRSEQHKQNAGQSDDHSSEFASDHLVSSSPVSSSINLLSNLSKSTSNVHRTRSNDLVSQLTMGSSSSKCSKITDQTNSCTNGWVNVHCPNLPPQLNQPYLHHSCSMINLTAASDCLCCNPYVHHNDGKSFDA